MEEEEEATPPRPWSFLPSHLLWDISRKTGDVADYVRFCAVCKNWRAAAWPAAEECGHIGMELPWQILPQTETGMLHFYWFARWKDHRNISRPEFLGKFMCGFSNEWLALFDPSTRTLSLAHPVTRAQIPLPPITWSPVPGAVQESVEESLISKAVHSLNSVGADSVEYGGLSGRLEEYRKRYVRDVFPTSSNPKEAGAKVVAILGDSRRSAFCHLAGAGKSQGWTIVE